MNARSSALLVISALLMASGLHAGPVSSCTPNFSACSVFEDRQVLHLPGLAIAGDLLITEPWNSAIVSDVFRIFNDVFNSGGGTGLGDAAFLYSADLKNLPLPASYSVNAVAIREGPSIGGGLSRTDYNGNGTLYSIFSSDATPEPSTLALLGSGALVLIWRRLRPGRPRRPAS